MMNGDREMKNSDCEGGQNDATPSGFCARTMEIEMQYSSPHHSPTNNDERKRWFSSTRTASLLDDQDDDEDEGGVLEPELEIITEDENSSMSSKSDQEDHHKTSVMEESASDEGLEIESGSPLVRFSENMSGMANYLCPVVFPPSSDDLQFQTRAISLPKPFHERNVSDTDSLQLLASSGPCGSSAVFNLSTTTDPVVAPKTSQENRTPPTPPPPPSSSMPVACSDLEFLDLKQLLVSDISMLLGSPQGESWVSTMQRWLTDPTTTTSTKTGIGRRGIYNRCTVHNARSRRVRHLWLTWHGRTDSMFNSNNNNIAARTLGMTRSFDDITTNVPPPMDTIDCYYDSDPETIAISRLKRGGIQEIRPGPIDTNASFGSTGHGEVPLAPKGSNHNRFPSFDSRSGSTETNSFQSAAKDDLHGFDVWDDQQVKRFVQHLTLGRRYSLIYHPPSKDCINMPPVSVQCWFEMGSRLQNTLIHPKFMWRETYIPDIDHRKLSESCRAPSALDILTMVRILIPTKLDRTAFPYAKLDHTFTIKTSKGKSLHVFEAQSTKERDWFVHGLKLVVARLASMIIVGDDQMFLEFFSPSPYSPMFQRRPSDDTLSKESRGDDSSKGNGGGSDDVAKPFYISTTPKDRDKLWGTTTTTTATTANSTAIAS